VYRIWKRDQCNALDELEPGPAREALPQRAVAYEVQRALVEALERFFESHDVLALAQRAEAEERRVAVRRGLNGKAPEVDAGIDHLGLATRLRDLGLELAAQV